MTPPTDAQQVRHWQEEVAKDPGSPAFLPLAEVYRREGRLEVARRLCIRGLERHPEHVEAHVLLGRVYRESGELEKAYDELDIALGLEPAHQAARRAIGYLCLERRDWAGAARHLGEAARQDPSDERLTSALALARRHAEATAAAAPERSPDAGQALAPALDRLVREARLRLVLLTEGSGKVVAQHGFTREQDMAAFATLGAGIQSASRALAGVLGEPGFEQLHQGEGDRQLFLAPVRTPLGELVLLAAFGEESTIGLVRVHFEEFEREVETLDWSPVVRGGASTFEAELAAGLHRALGVDPHSPAP